MSDIGRNWKEKVYPTLIRYQKEIGADTENSKARNIITCYSMFEKLPEQGSFSLLECNLNDWLKEKGFDWVTQPVKERCTRCGHALENNKHKPDLRDYVLNSDTGKVTHSGSCIRCKECRNEKNKTRMS